MTTKVWEKIGALDAKSAGELNFIISAVLSGEDEYLFRGEKGIEMERTTEEPKKSAPQARRIDSDRI